MYVVPVAWISHVAQVRGAGSDDVRGGLAAACLPPEVVDSTATHVSARQFATFIEEAARIAGEEFYGLALGLRYDVRASGLVAYVSLACATVRDGLRNTCRYGAMSDTSADYALTEIGERAFFRIESRAPQIRMSRHATEFKLALFAEACRTWGGPAVRPREACLALTRSSARESERLLGCAVHYGAGTTGLIFECAQLELTPLSSDRYLLELLERVAADRLAKRTLSPNATRARVERLLLDRLASGAPAAHEVAEALGIGERTLARRLAAESTSYGQLLDDFRRSMALGYLDDPGISLAQIAYLLGYADQSGFSNAFRRWTGQSPSRFRAGAATA